MGGWAGVCIGMGTRHEVRVQIWNGVLIGWLLLFFFKLLLLATWAYTLRFLPTKLSRLVGGGCPGAYLSFYNIPFPLYSRGMRTALSIEYCC